MDTHDSARARRHALHAGLYAAFVVYGSLIPFHFRPHDWATAWQHFLHIPYLRLGLASRADWIANILLYIPLAYFTAAAWVGSRRGVLGRVSATAGVWLLCAGLAAAVEFTQIFFAPRTVSLNDLYAEGIGAALGLAAWHGLGPRLDALARALTLNDPRAPRVLALFYAALYLGLAVFPFDFVVSGAELAWKTQRGMAGPWLAPRSCPGGLACVWPRLFEIAAALPLGLGFALLSPRRSGLEGWIAAVGWGLGLGFGLEALQYLTASNVSQGASALSRALGIVLGYAAFPRLEPARLERALAVLGRPSGLAVAAFLYVAVLASLIRAGQDGWLDPAAAGQRLRQVRYIPFYYHYFTSETRALESAVAHVLLYLPIGLLVYARGGGTGRHGRWASVALGFGVALAVEAVRLFLPHTGPDPTNALIGGAGAGLGHWALGVLHRTAAVPAPHRPAAVEWLAGIPRPARLTLAALGLSAVAGLAWVLPQHAAGPAEAPADERRYPKLPESEQLPPARLPSFKQAHPRLPAPSPAELDRLKSQNPRYLERTARQARGGQGAFDATILTAYADPGAPPLEPLFNRLMALKFTDRGHVQVKPLALAYDWLYDRWTPEQRAALLDKTLAGCRYEIDFIRDERLSPYNVYLYNSPFQALVACAIAVYGDRPDAAPVMNFTWDLWRNRVLPVWRQIMGRNGGWHEGAEYVGIGIGQAVHQVPALWRAATGEDLFRSEPGLKGFLDFLVYRTRPDGTHLRLGDGGFFNRDAPDRVPLALELNHPAAYSLNCPPPHQPSGWPWGPLTRPELCDPAAVRSLPLDRRFDGIGLVVARSGWDPDATLAVFKAGDNYWSHSHLDQGSFTLYKGGALAIDSGLYGPRYGSDHHLDYAYQTIAHNAITVTDPADTAPLPGPKEPRLIANDGGQRRVGSGWGGEPAPLDLTEWHRQRDLYHTGRVLRYVSERGLVLAVADLTPAYTNRWSRPGSFFHRARRVERLVRTFLYDRINDVALIHDRVRATEAFFPKRSLLHSLEAPVRTPSGFRVAAKAEPRPGHAGGVLDVSVLWPKEAFIDVVGGPGAEFWVNGRNYDEQGQIWATAARRPLAEPGRWRVEIRPRRPALEDDFLMVLQPRIAGHPEPALAIREIVADEGPGCEIRGPGRRLTVLFPAGSALPVVSLDGASIKTGD
jgi:VanZ family protein